VQVKTFGKNSARPTNEKAGNHMATIARKERDRACWAIFFPLHQMFYTPMALLKLG
jgi:hypothetical protein